MPPSACHLPKRRTASLLMLSLAMPGRALSAAPLEVQHPGPRSATDRRAAYYIKLLDLALAHSGAEYVLRANPLPMVGARVVQDMVAGQGINVTWLPASPELEQVLIPVRMPLDRGILGWRVFLIRQQDRARFAAVRSLAQLRTLSAGLQRDWGDVAILQANGLNVVTAATYEGLFPMLAAGRFDYFPRGIGEVWGEAERYEELGLAIEPRLALHYEFPSYFYVSPQLPQLAQALQRGLEAVQRSGQLEKLFQEFNGDSIRRARLAARTVFRLKLPSRV